MISRKSDYLDNVVFLRLLARDRQIPAFLDGVTPATGSWQSPSSEHDSVKLPTQAVEMA
jgi:hypothetical protein